MNVIKHTKRGIVLYNPQDEYIGRSLTNYGEYEENEIKFFEAVIHPGDWVVDVGSNIGCHTIAFSKLVGNQGAVWAFEPQRQVYYALCANIALNNLSNVYAFQQAVSSKDGKMRVPELDFKLPGNYGALELTKPYSPTKPHSSARVTTIDSLNLQRCNLIKIDVEGMELNVLMGSRKTIETFQPILFVECDRQDKAPYLIQHIKGLGYKTYIYKSLLFNPENFHQNSNNVFGNLGCLNLICIPEFLAAEFEQNNELTPIDESAFNETAPIKQPDGLTDVDINAMNNLMSSAQVYLNNYNFKKSIRYLNLAKKINKNEPSIYQGFSAIMSKQLKYEKSLKYLNKCLDLNPNNLDLLNSKAMTLGFLNRSAEAIETYQTYLMQRENDAMGHFNMSLEMLKIGDFQNGWPEYEYRLLLPKSAAYIEKFNKAPFWDGSPNKRILFFIEQGVGDLFQFVRYAQLVKERNCYIISEMWEDTKDLQYEFIDETVTIKHFTEELSRPVEFDCIMSWCSLPKLFKTDLTNIPSNIPYIKPTGEYKKELNGIGIVWAGSVVHDNDQIRSCFLRDLKPLEATGKQLYSLQLGSMNRTWNHIGDVNLMEDSDVKYIDLASEIKDFNDTAKILDKLDAIITVDTSVAHLAGAMGKKVYLALPKSCDFRWMHNRTDSPWYPTMKIYRQKEFTEWREVFERIAKDL